MVRDFAIAGVLLAAIIVFGLMAVAGELARPFFRGAPHDEDEVWQAKRRERARDD
jgi:hypothetical protein